MDDLDKFIKDTEDTVAKSQGAIAEYEASGDNLDRLRREAMREMERFEDLRKDDKLKLDMAVDLYMEASELKLAVFEGVGEIGEAYDDFLGFEDDDVTNIHNYPIEIQLKFYEMSPEEQEAIVAETKRMAEEAAANPDAPAAPKAQRKRMSV